MRSRPLPHRRILTGLAILLLAIAPPGFAALAAHSGEIIVRYQEHAQPDTLLLQSQRRNGFGQMVRRLRAPATIVVRPEAHEDFDQVLERYRADPTVAYAEPNWTVELMASAPLPDDPAFGDTGEEGIWWVCQDIINRLCQQRGQGDTRVSYAWEAWRQHTGENAPGSSEVMVAIIDTGVDANPPDLRDNVSAASRRHISGDTGAFSDVTDMDGHGTHIAGIIGAVGDNTEGLAGINWRVDLLALKVFPDMDPSSSGSTALRPTATVADVVEAIHTAIEEGARVINASYGYERPSSADQDALSAARDAGILVVAAAGNTGRDNDQSPIYPASYPLDNIISVAASSIQGNFTSYSNHGRNTVHVAAPGGGNGPAIYSTFPTTLDDEPEIRSQATQSDYGNLAGTSMATPMVSGAAALTLALDPDLSYRELRERIVQSARPDPTLAQRLIGPGLLDIEALVLGTIDPLGQPLEPMRPTRLSAQPLANGDVRLRWLDNSVLNEAYAIDRLGPEDENWRVVGEVAANADSFVDSPFNGEPAPLQYRVRALKSGAGAECCVSDVVDVDSGVLHYQQGSRSMSSSSDCFIATAAYGTPLAADVQVLRDFRDDRLRNTAMGRWFIRQYERLSPPVADQIAERPRLRALVRGLLRPIIALLR
ncbi:MAG: S8 family serine peptidase [Ectothiorhodospiraceae bacterium]|nr:S8 family serine peptidase [Ectothiorhodospiraceae bacterium]